MRKRDKVRDSIYNREKYALHRKLGLCGMCGKVEVKEFANCPECRRRTAIRTNSSKRKKDEVH